MMRLGMNFLSFCRRHPLASGLVIFLSIVAVTYFISGLLPVPVAKGDDLTSRIDRAGAYLGFFSVAAAWAIAANLWLKKKDAALNFRHAGAKIEEVERAFDASVILASKFVQPEWHIRHIRPECVEFVWTSYNEEKTKGLLDTFNVVCAHGPGRHDEWQLADPYDMKAVKDLTRKLISSLIARGYRRERICVDLTSGTGVMTIGAFQAAEMMGVTSIFLAGNSRRNGNPVIDEKKVNRADEAEVILLSDHRKQTEGSHENN